MANQFPDKFNYKGLIAYLTQSKLQTTNPAAYQTILGLIDGAQNWASFSQQFGQQIVNTFTPGPTPSSGIRVLASKAISNAEILTLPTTVVTLLAAQGTTNIILPLLVFLQGSIFNKYTNIDADSYVQIQYNGPLGWSNYIANDSTLGYTQVNDTFGTDGIIIATSFEPYNFVEPIFAWGNLVGSSGDYNIVNRALELTINNGGSGNFTGGNASNHLIATVIGTIVAVA